MVIDDIKDDNGTKSIKKLIRQATLFNPQARPTSQAVLEMLEAQSHGQVSQDTEIVYSQQNQPKPAQNRGHIDISPRHREPVGELIIMKNS